MAIGNYLPLHDKERVAWFKNFINQFTLYASIFNFTPDEIEGIRKDCTKFTNMVDSVTVLKYGSKKHPGSRTAVIQKDADTEPSISSMPSAALDIPAGIFRRLSFTIRKIKNHGSYSEALGLALGIIGEDRSFIPSVEGVSEI
jgi:hypothetical protein